MFADALMELGAASATTEPDEEGAPRSAASLFRAGSLAGERAFYYVDASTRPVATEEALATWKKVRVTALFPKSAQSEVHDTVKTAATWAGLDGAEYAGDKLPVDTSPSIVHYAVADDALDDSWMTRLVGSLSPMKIDEFTTVVPVSADETASRKDDENENHMTLYVEPGFAFGTGDHPTTALCLRAIRKHLDDSYASKPVTILDYGAGTGILGVAALELHRRLSPENRHAVMLDIDPNAVSACALTANLNGVPSSEVTSSLCTESGAVDPDDAASALIDSDVGQFDIVVANVLLPPLLSLAPYLCSRVKRDGGVLILSGILAGDQVSQLRDAYEAQGLVFVEEHTQASECTGSSMWACVVMRP